MTDDSSQGIPGQADIIDNIIASGYAIKRLLDIGFGAGHAARAFADAGIQVSATGFNVDRHQPGDQLHGSDIEVYESVDVCDMGLFAADSFDAIWCSHVLEHVLDTGRALQEIRRVLKDDGLLFVSVPPFKHQVVGGHVHPGWNVGVLLYVLVANGFDAGSGEFVRHGYNISGVVRNCKPAAYMSKMTFAGGDLEILAQHGLTPPGLDFRQGFNGNIRNLNWRWRITPQCSIPISKRVSNDEPRIASPAELDRAYNLLGTCIPEVDYGQMTPRDLIQLHLPNRAFFRVLKLRRSGKDIYGPALLAHNKDFEVHEHLVASSHRKMDEGVEQYLLENYPSQSMDYVVCHDVFTGSDRPQQLIRDVARVMRGGGLLLGWITIVDPSSLLEFSSFNIVSWKKSLKQAGIGVEAFYAGIDARSLAQVRSCGERPREGRPFSYSQRNKRLDEIYKKRDMRELNLQKLLNCGLLFFCAKRSL